MRLWILAALLGAVLAAAPAAAQTGAYKAPRNAFGQPDLEGVWNTQFILPLEARADAPNLVVSEAESRALAKRIADEIARSAVNFFDPEVPEMNYASAAKGMAIVKGQRRSRQVVLPADGRIPFAPQYRRMQQNLDRSIETDLEPQMVADHPEQRSSWERCLAMQGDPPISVLNDVNPRNIVLTRDHVVIHTEYGNEVRIIPFTDNHRPAPMRDPLGDAIARWEGDTLVVETIRLPSVHRVRVLPFLLVPYSATVIERYTRAGKDELLYQFTVIEPSIYTASWLAEYSLYRTRTPMYEFACHEGNYSMRNILGAAREAEKRAAAARQGGSQP